MTQSAPRSIDQYLAQLRAALAGEDAALILAITVVIDMMAHEGR